MTRDNRDLTIQGLAERAAQRRRDRRTLNALKRSVSDYPKNEQRARHAAITYISTLPTKTLVAVHRAAVQFHEQQNTTDTPI